MSEGGLSGGMDATALAGVFPKSATVLEQAAPQAPAPAEPSTEGTATTPPASVDTEPSADVLAKMFPRSAADLGITAERASAEASTGPAVQKPEEPVAAAGAKAEAEPTETNAETFWEGFEPPAEASFDSELARSVTPELIKLGFTKSDGQKLANAHAALERAREARETERVKGWETAARSHPELRNDFDGSVRMARQLFDHYGHDLKDLRSQLDATGLGSHPELLVLLSRVARGERR